MKIGFIGAGKVGFSFGKYLTERDMRVTGYYSRNPQSSMEAAGFTNTRQYTKMRDLVEDSDIIFLAVPDGAIFSVWEQLKMLPIQNKIISHFSGSLSSAIFLDIERYNAYGYSIHPLFAINDKYNSYKELSGAFLTVEGHPKYINWFLQLFSRFGNSVQVISADDKVRYHAAAAMASNLYVGLVNLCEDMLKECGFSAQNAHKALSPLLLGNVENIIHYGTAAALTGPVERNDVGTVMSHLECLTPEEHEVYLCLSKEVLKVAKKKHLNRDYREMEGVITQ
jgi:predicted short-subunit dehydrogenase-like oxidoreductase (DUF2520 family)